jgi:DNA-binding response OmpR family regulator
LHQEDIELSSLTFDESKPTLLLVDDNKDILMVLNEHFKLDFNILMAEDGEKALAICNDKYPDIIVSDVMMPKMTGLELCHEIKSKLKTSFIPVVLLTARGTTEQQIEGLEEGADAYIPKPFHLGLLQTTIVNLLNKSKQTNEFLIYKNTDSVEPKNTRSEVLNNDNQEFINKLTQLIEKNIDKSNYSIDTLCQDIGMGRSKLYARIKSTLNVSLGEYMREIRLQKAAELLRTTSLSISEVSFKVGIDNTSFFSRSFKERFGVRPSEYINKGNN